MELIYLLAGVALGALVGWVTGRSRAAGTQSLLDAELRRAAAIQQALDRERAMHAEANASLAATEANFRNLEEKLSEKKKELEELHTKMTDQFRNLANSILEEKSRVFSEQNKSSLTDLLQPLGERLQAFEKKVSETHHDSVARNAALREQLENLQKLNVQMTREAENLTRALKGDSQAQGAWGEFILESILQKSGLEKDREYTIQETFSTPEGRFRPDVIVRLPENKHVIIDSKVSLNAYNNFVNSNSDEEKQAALKAHLVSIRTHMKGLAEKNYQKNVLETGLDFIIMFIPIEPAYMLAIQSEKDLYEEALQRRIVFVSPTLLIPSLQLIKNVWKQEHQNRHVIDIANKAGDLYDKFAAFADDLLNLGRQLDISKRHYDESMKKLAVGSGNLVRRVEELKKLGARAGKTIDPRLLSRSEDQADLFGDTP